MSRATLRHAAAARPTAPVRPRNKKARPVRSVVVVTVVAGLIATVALPAFAAREQPSEAQTLQQVAAGDSQSLVIGSDATAASLSRNSYAATTADEIAKKKAEEAAAERARLVPTIASIPVDLHMVAPGTGEVRWPLATIDHIGDGFLARGGEHMGVDLLTAGGTPIFAAAAGIVRVSQESYGGYGVAITIDHVINGQQVGTLYGHMTYGSRQVQVGDTVAAGQLIGLVGSTGSSTANHLHFEVFIDGHNVDPLAWLEANAG